MPDPKKDWKPGDWPPESYEDRIAILEQYLREKGNPVRVVPGTGGQRSASDQRKLFAKGRTVMGVGRPTPNRPFGATVTDKSGEPGDESRHQLNMARDFMFTGGKEDWDLLGNTATQLGMEWGGNLWKRAPGRRKVKNALTGQMDPVDPSFIDRPHVQMPFGRRTISGIGSPTEAEEYKRKLPKHVHPGEK